MINPGAPLLSDEVIQRCKKLCVAMLLDGAKTSGLDILNDGCMDAQIMPVAQGMTVIGTAFTVDARDGDNFPVHVACYAQPGDGYVMVIDGKKYEQRSYVGDLIMGSCQAAGFEGIVIDGYSRDRDGNVELDFPVYSRGFMPRGPIKKEMGGINVSIMCGGVKVEPGDLVMGDSDGVCVIPRQHIETVLAEAEKKCAYEENRKATIAAYKEARANNQPLPQLAPQWVLELLNS